MKACILFIALIFCLAPSKAQVIDVAPTRSKNYRPVEGGEMHVRINKKTPLIMLIKRLQKKWEFVETYKAYWIGYTDDMYSIANYRSKAIDPLIEFIDTTKNLHARIGALYTVHLIGINSTIVGRFVEDFVDIQARNVLLRYLNDKALNSTIVTLLLRDPWLSDIPKLMDYLSVPGRDYGATLSALQRYEFKGKPVGQDITGENFEKKVVIPTRGNQGLKPMYAFITFKSKLAPYFIVDDEIINSREWKEGLKELSVKTSASQNSSVIFYFSGERTRLYCGFETSYFYSFNGNNKVNLFGPTKARELWLKWWNTLSEQEKRLRFSSNHVALN